jgi:hypothetical protein
LDRGPAIHKAAAYKQVNINTDRHLCLEWDSKQRPQRLRGRKQFIPQIVRPLWLPDTHEQVENPHIFTQTCTSVRLPRWGVTLPSYGRHASLSGGDEPSDLFRTLACNARIVRNTINICPVARIRKCEMKSLMRIPDFQLLAMIRGQNIEKGHMDHASLLARIPSQSHVHAVL